MTSVSGRGTVSVEPWPANFSHADSIPEGGYRVVRIVKDQTDAEEGLTIIFLHGAGEGDGVEGWVGLWRSLLEHLPSGTEVLLPSGPLVNPPSGQLAKHFVSSAPGSPRPSWFKLRIPSNWKFSDGAFNTPDWVFGGIDEVATKIQDLVSSESQRHSRSVVLGGFSQGGSAAFWSGIVASSGVGQTRPAGIFSLSGYLPQPHRLPVGCQPPPVLLMHGDVDPVIPVSALDAAVQVFADQGWVDVTVHRFSGLAHRVKREELLILCEWLCQLQSNAPQDNSNLTGIAVSSLASHRSSSRL